MEGISDDEIRRGWSTVVGGFCIHLVLGTLYCWANVTSAVTSRLRSVDPSVTYNETINVYATELVSQGFTMLLGGLLSERIGTRRTCLLGALLLVIATFGAAASDRLWSLILCQGVLFGSGTGLAYTAPIAAAVRWMPRRKGTATGLILAGFGLGAFVFGLVATHVVNPHQQSVNSDGADENYFSADSEVVAQVPRMYATLGACYAAVLAVGCWLVQDPPPVTADDSANAYTATITSNTTLSGARSSSGMIAVSGSISGRYHGAPTVDTDTDTNNNNEAEGFEGSRGSVVTDNPMREMAVVVMRREVELRRVSSPSVLLVATNHIHSEVNEEEGRKEEGESEEGEEVVIEFQHQRGARQLTSREVLTQPLAWHIASCFIATTVGGMYLAGTFKTFGQQHISDETFLSSVSAVSSVFNSLGRVWWGMLADRHGPLPTLVVMSALFSGVLITFPWSVHLGEGGFACWSFLLFFFEGGNFVLYFPIVVAGFGERNAASNYGLIFTSYSFLVMITILVLSQSGLSFAVLSVLLGLLTFLGCMNVLCLRWHLELFQRSGTHKN
jgi:MFS family permease